METSVFIISLVAVIIATASTLISYLLFRDAKDPQIFVYATPDHERPSVINLIIENTGRSPAWEVRFQSSKPVPKEAFGIEDARHPEPMDRGPLINGIPCLGPGSKRILTWGQFDGLRKGIGEGYLDITAIYSSYPALAFKPRRHKTVSRLDIMSFECSEASDHNWDKKIAKELKVISDTLSRMRASHENALEVLRVEKHESNLWTS